MEGPHVSEPSAAPAALAAEEHRQLTQPHGAQSQQGGRGSPWQVRTAVRSAGARSRNSRQNPENLFATRLSTRNHDRMSGASDGTSVGDGGGVETPPRAAGVRIAWPSVPARLRCAVEQQLGGRVVEAVTQPGGFSPGVAARLKTATGTRAFVKAVGPELDPESPGIHRAEARIAAALPEGTPAPRLLGFFDEDGWVALVFEDIEGTLPVLPWKAAELGGRCRRSHVGPCRPSGRQRIADRRPRSGRRLAVGLPGRAVVRPGRDAAERPYARRPITR